VSSSSGTSFAGSRSVPSRARLLDPDSVAAYLETRGLVEPGEAVEVSELGGGVSNVVLAVETARLRVVVKQALPRLRVEDEWLAPRQRALTEADALALAGRLTPGFVPAVLDRDERACALTIELAPPDWRNWKSLLLDGEVDPAVARRTGELLAAWHRETAGDSSLAPFRDLTAFEALRVDPYLRTIMRRCPAISAEVGAYVSHLLSTRRCLVHGDYSPKNVLVGDGRLWLLDFEVAHLGDPAFDLAFMLNHLMLKTIHRPELAPEYERSGLVFWKAYVSGVPAELAPDAEYVLGLLGCLMVARVDGKSPAEYLTERGREAARAHGTVLLREPPTSLEAAWP